MRAKMEPGMYALWAALVLLLVMALTACAQLGVPTADSCNERVAISIATVTQVRTSALDLLKAKRLSVPDAENVLMQSDHARTGVDLARALCGTDPTGASNKLVAASTILQALNTYLSTRGN